MKLPPPRQFSQGDTYRSDRKWTRCHGNSSAMVSWHFGLAYFILSVWANFCICCEQWKNPFPMWVTLCLRLALPRALGEHSVWVHLSPFIHLAFLPLQAFVSTELLMGSITLPPAPGCPIWSGFWLSGTAHLPQAPGLPSWGQCGETDTLGFNMHCCVRHEKWWLGKQCLSSSVTLGGDPGGGAGQWKLPNLLYSIWTQVHLWGCHNEVRAGAPADKIAGLQLSWAARLDMASREHL